MVSKLTLLPLISLLTAAATALPSMSINDDVRCDGDYLVEKWGTVVAQPSYNSSNFGEFKGCRSKDLFRRDDYDTRVEPNDDNMHDASFGDDAAPHDTLWGRALELCGDTFCDGEKNIMTGTNETPDGSQLVLNLDGNFADSTLRDHFISLIKQAYYKSVTSTVVGEGSSSITRYTGASFVHATTTYGAASGYYLTARLTIQDPSNPGCPQFVQTIQGAGAFTGELAPVFGIIGIVCGSV